MKKFSLIFILTMMVFVTGCGENKASNVGVESDEETGVLEENVSIVEAQEGAIAFPEIEYEEWLTDEDGNKLFGFNVPLGWICEEGNVGKEYIPVGLKSQDSDSQISDISVVCSTDEYLNWYDTDMAPDYLTESGRTYSLEKIIDTEYGVCKIFCGKSASENHADDVSGLIKINDKWCVWIHSYSSWEGLDATCQFLEDYIRIITSEKQEPIVVDYEYPYYLTDENGNKLMGLNTPTGMTRMEDDPAICMQNGSKYIRVLNTTYNYAYQIMSGGDEDVVYTEKGEVETVYGTAQIYEQRIINETYGDIYSEMALFNVNGVYIWIQYNDYGAEGYTSELEEIITNQLFVQE